VANLEAGRRRLSAVELLILPEMLNFAVEVHADRPRTVVELADLLPETGWIALTDETRVQAHALRMLLRGQLSQVHTTDLDIPIMRQVHARGQEMLSHLHRSLENRERIRRAVWPDAGDPELWAASEEATGEAEQKAARRLGVPALAVALEARRRWGRSLSAERDQRVGAQAPGRTDLRGLQALRGHVSRLLLAELKELGAYFQNETLAKPRDSAHPQIKPASARHRPSKSDR
jgi:hypothetical protein